MRRACIALFLLAASCRGPAPPPAPVAVTPTTVAEGVEVFGASHLGAGFTVVRVDLRSARVGMLWKDASGASYAGVGAAAERAGDGLVAVTNAGIYGRDLAPEGLHVEGGRTLVALNLRGGGGNFYWKP